MSERRLHPRLARQLAHHLGPGARLPEELAVLLSAIDASYHEADADRAELADALDALSGQLERARRGQGARTVIERALRESEERFRALVENMQEAVIITDLDDTVLYASPRTLALLGHDPEALLGRGVDGVLFPREEREAMRARLGRRAAGHAERYEAEVLRPDGSRVWVEVSAAPFRDAAGDIVGTLGTFTDISARRQAEHRLRASESRYRAIFDQAAIGVAEIDAEGRIVTANAAFQRILGYEAWELTGLAAIGLAHPDDVALIELAARDTMLGWRDGFEIEARHVRKGGQTIWTSLSVSRLRASADAASFVAILQDVTERKELEAQLTQRAFHDPLTGLANRALFRDRVAHALKRDARASGRVAVLFVELDDFRTVNDSFGHEAGDELLASVGLRLLTCLRGADTVARLGGDEFGVLLEDVQSDDEAVMVVERVTSALAAPMSIGGGGVFIGASIGIAHSRDAASADELLRNADVAMYTAKMGGKGRFALYEPEMHARVVERQQIEADLRPALERGELELVYQPIVHLRSGCVAGVEALARWRHPAKGIIPPTRFIPVAEDTGLIVPIGRWILREACRQGAAWRTLLAGDEVDGLAISVNISGHQLRDAQFLDDVRDALADSELPARSLVLEITESVLMDGLDATIERLAALKALGVRLAIDDFGTGYSSLSYLQRFPVDVLKIDKSFTDGIGQGPHDAALVRTIVALSETMQLRTVAEGIEAREQRAALLDLGCEYGQGYLFAHPLAAAELERLLGAELATAV